MRHSLFGATHSAPETRHHGRRTNRPSSSLRLHHHLPLHFSSTHHGPRAPHLHPQNPRPPHRQRDLERLRQLLGQDFRHQLCPRRRHRHSHGISVRHQLVAIFQIRRRCNRPNSGDGRRLLLLSRILFPRPF